MLATPWERPFADPGWSFEPKWDGYRAILTWDGTEVHLRSRRGNDFTDTYSELSAFRATRPCVIDGEIVALGADGRPSFELLQGRKRSRIAVSMVAFDLLFDGEPIIGLPLEDRQERLTALGPEPPFVTVEPIRGDGHAMWDAVVDRGLEGMVAKRLGSSYRPGVRSPDWRKVVHVNSLRAVVGGFTVGEGGRTGTLGSLVMGLWEGDRLRWIGNVGTGFSDADLMAVKEALDEMERSDPAFHDSAAIEGMPTWIEPVLVARIGFREWTSAGRLRAPRFQGFTDDPVEVVTWEQEGP